MKNKKAFTFIEFLIALSIFAIMAASIYYTLNAGVAIYRRGNAMIRDNQKLRISFDMMSLDLRNAVLYPEIETEGTREKIALPSIVNFSEEGYMAQRLVKAIYYFDGKRLLRKYALNKEDFDEEKAVEEVLIEKFDDFEVDDFEFKYAYELEGLEGEYEWRNDWTTLDKIPRGIKAKLTLKNKFTDKKDIFEKTIFVPMGVFGSDNEAS